MNVIGFMAGHHLISRNSIEYTVHNRPLRRGLTPTARSLFFGKFSGLTNTEVAMQPAVHDKDPAPNDVAGLGNTFDRAAAEPEVHRGLALAHGPLEAANQVGRWHGS